MNQNIGKKDAAIRISVAITISILLFTRVIPAAFASILLGIGGYLMFTSVLGLCVVYGLLGYSTYKKE